VLTDKVSHKQTLLKTILSLLRYAARMVMIVIRFSVILVCRQFIYTLAIRNVEFPFTVFGANLKLLSIT